MESIESHPSMEFLLLIGTPIIGRGDTAASIPGEMSGSSCSCYDNIYTFLKEMQIPVLVDIVSAHRTPEKLISFGKNAHKEGINVIIAGAGGAAHLPWYASSSVPSSYYWCSY